MHRFGGVLVAALGVAHAFGDELFLSPTATKIRTTEPRLQWIGSQHSQLWRVGFGLDNGLDGFVSRDSVSLGYNYLPAITDSTPGLSFGIQDVGKKTASGYVVLSYKYGQVGTYNQNTPFLVTMGLRTGGEGTGILSAQAPFADRFRGLVEFDRGQLTAGLDVRPVPELSLKWMFRSSETLLSATWFVKF